MFFVFWMLGIGVVGNPVWSFEYSPRDSFRSLISTPVLEYPSHSESQHSMTALELHLTPFGRRLWRRNGMNCRVA